MQAFSSHHREPPRRGRFAETIRALLNHGGFDAEPTNLDTEVLAPLTQSSSISALHEHVLMLHSI